MATGQSSSALAQPLPEAKFTAELAQYSTFTVAQRVYGIDVTQVQEVVKPMPMTTVPLAPDYIAGLINLRGQVATAIGLRELFGLPLVPHDQLMNVVCKIQGNLISFQVDEIGDVVEISRKKFEETPSIIPEKIKRFLGGIYKAQSGILSIIEIDPIAQFLGLTAKRTGESPT